MRIIAIGDPHGDLKKIRKIPVKRADLIILTGDLGDADLLRKMSLDNLERQKKGLPKIKYSPRQEREAFFEAYKSCMKVVAYLSEFAPVYVVFGNVESSKKETEKWSKKIGFELPFLEDDLNSLRGVKVINNRVVDFRGLKIGGVPYFIDVSWVKDFKPPDFKKRMGKAVKQTKEAKNMLKEFGRLVILVCHQPPYGILDKSMSKFTPKDWYGKHAGSKVILDYVKRKQPKIVLCGHIHEQEGCKKVGKTKVYNLGTGGYKVIEF